MTKFNTITCRAFLAIALVAASVGASAQAARVLGAAASSNIGAAAGVGIDKQAIYDKIQITDNTVASNRNESWTWANNAQNSANYAINYAGDVNNNAWAWSQNAQATANNAQATANWAGQVGTDAQGRASNAQATADSLAGRIDATWNLGIADCAMAMGGVMWAGFCASANPRPW